MELFVVQAGPFYFIVRVKAAVDAVVVAVVGKINRGHDGNVVAEVTARDQMAFWAISSRKGPRLSIREP